MCVLYSVKNNSIILGTQKISESTVDSRPHDCSLVYGQKVSAGLPQNIRFVVRHVSDPYIVGEAYLSTEVDFYFGSIIFLLLSIFLLLLSIFLLVCATIYAIYYCFVKKE